LIGAARAEKSCRARRCARRNVGKNSRARASRAAADGFGRRRRGESVGPIRAFCPRTLLSAPVSGRSPQKNFGLVNPALRPFPRLRKRV